MIINPVPVPKRRKPYGYWYKVLSDFVKSNQECIQLVPNPGEYKDIRAFQACVASAIARYKFNLSTKKGDGCLYVIKKIRKGNV